MSRLAATFAVLGAAVLVIGGALGAQRLQAAVPAPVVSLHATGALEVVPGVAESVTVPATGSMVLEARGPRLGSGVDLLAAQSDTEVRAIGSVAKTMTALEVLAAHPLHGDEDGPQLVMSAEDVQLWRDAVAADGSNLPVTVGERFTERQLLLGMMLPSANNLAETLARWVAGSREAFVTRLNARAAALGMPATHFDDPSGLSPRTVSTARDLLPLGRAALADPVLAAVVATQRAGMPDGTQVSNLDTNLTTEPGWLGIKTGTTAQAGACLLFAARRAPDGDGDAADALTLVGAILGQPDRASALSSAKQAVDTAMHGYAAASLPTLQPGVAGTVSTDWGSGAGVRLGVSLTGGTLVVRLGARLSLLTRAGSVGVPLPDGAAVGEVEALAGGEVVARWAVVSDGAVEAPSWSWRLLHG